MLLWRWQNSAEVLRRALFLFTILSFCGVGEAETKSVTIPRLTAPVMDQAGLLQKPTVRRLRGLLHQVKKQMGTQLVVLVVPSLEDEPIESLSLRVVEKWKLGSKKEDNGVLLLIAKKERKMRIEVGEGLEGNLTDAYSKRVIGDVITPHFKRGQFDNGVMAGVFQILRYAHPDANWKGLSGTAAKGQVHGKKSRQKKSMGLFEIILFLLVIVMAIVSPTFRTLLFISLLSGGRRGGGGGFGGFSGGGGGFSGGGASGGW